MKRPSSGLVVATLQVVQSCFTVVVVTTVTEGVESCYSVHVGKHFAIAVSVVGIFGYFGSTVVYSNNVSEYVLAVSIQCIVVNKPCRTFTVVKECKILCGLTSRSNNLFLH